MYCIDGDFFIHSILLGKHFARLSALSNVRHVGRLGDMHVIFMALFDQLSNTHYGLFLTNHVAVLTDALFELRKLRFSQLVSAKFFESLENELSYDIDSYRLFPDIRVVSTLRAALLRLLRRVLTSATFNFHVLRTACSSSTCIGFGVI